MAAGFSNCSLELLEFTNMVILRFSGLILSLWSPTTFLATTTFLAALNARSLAIDDGGGLK